MLKTFHFTNVTKIQGSSIFERGIQIEYYIDDEENKKKINTLDIVTNTTIENTIKATFNISRASDINKILFAFGKEMLLAGKILSNNTLKFNYDNYQDYKTKIKSILDYERIVTIDNPEIITIEIKNTIGFEVN